MNIPDWLLLVVCILITYRLARLLAYEDGPFDIFLQLRTAAGVYDYDADGQVHGLIGKLLSCPLCIGFWIALPVSFLFDFGWQTMVWWLAIAGGQSVLAAYEPE